MKKRDVIERLIDEKLMAIVRVETFERAREIVDGCLEGEVTCLEISYTNRNAGIIINQLSAYYGDEILIGAGTVLDSETARNAILNGAQFIISPSFSLDVAKLCNRYLIPYIPGCTSVTEIVTALESGVEFVKAFPISNFYGSQLVTVFKTPLPDILVLSSGGATIENLPDWLNAGVDCIGIGTLLTKGTKSEIGANAKALRKQIKKYAK
ncbi:MAG: ketohydroxyglutarate aldolase [Streptococcaceae bacterium]|jgi:2-dehydro-3-deoxyphosphogluconate aldolase/(4S)-4-hydroxy-2-oxoglutarate aldolase|nr:ketohydroxyglutarate aldolase [Streptococcaceae bacterium]MCH4176877.1 ketohydroxyglutarate aldolase [Streptococcaceae bacterium]